EVQMGIADDVDGFRIDTLSREHLPPAGSGVLHVHPFTRLCSGLVAGPRFDQHRVLVRTNHVAIETHADTVQLVRMIFLAPKGLWDDAEHCAAVPPIEPGAYLSDFKITQRHTGHDFRERCQPRTSRRPRSNRSAASSAICLPLS